MFHVFAALAAVSTLVALPTALAPSAHADAPAHEPQLPRAVTRWSADITEAARRHGLDPLLLAAVVQVESKGNPQAESPCGALGLLQVLPATAAKIARWRGVAPYTRGQLFDPHTNLDVGAWYLGRLLRTFGSVSLAAAAYNGGREAAWALRERGKPLTTETTRYRARVTGLYRALSSARKYEGLR